MSSTGRVIWAIILTAAVYAVTVSIPKITGLIDQPPGSWISFTVFTHLPMLILSLVLIQVFGRGDPASYGLKGVRAGVILRAILVGAIAAVVVGILPVVILVAIGGPEIVGEGLGSIRGMSALQMLLWVLILASVAEEFLFRGLMQGFLAPLSSYGIQLPKVRLTVPVILPALAFGLGHLVLLGSTRAPLVIVIVISTTLLGLVAGRYREKTGSIIPAIVVHMMFNVPGVLSKLGPGT